MRNEKNFEVKKIQGANDEPFADKDDVGKSISIDLSCMIGKL